MTTRDPQVLLEQQADAAEPVGMELTARLPVRFAGHRGGDGPLTRGQASTLGWVTNTALYTRMVEWPLTIPAGTTVADIGAAVAVLMGRHESLRTTFPAVRPPVQRVARSGTLAIDVYAASRAPSEPAVLNVALTRLLRSREFDLEADLPVRVAVATWHGAPLAASILYSHVAVDFASMALIGRQFTGLIGDTARRAGSVTPDRSPAHQPLDQAAYEQSALGTRRNAAALRGWETRLRIMPQCLYAVPADNAGPAGGESGWLWSRAAALALPHIAGRTRTSRQLVVFAALCTMLAWRTGHPGCVLPVSSSNRYQRHLSGYVGSLAQDCMMSVDTRGDSLDAVVRHASTAALRGKHNGLVDLIALDAVIERVEHDRGFKYERHCVFNDLSLHLGDTDDGPQAPGADPVRGQTRFEVLPAPPIQEILLVLLQQVNGELILGGLTRDASLLPAGEIETMLRGVEALLVAGAAGDVDLGRLGEVTGVRPIERGPGWYRVDGSWIDLAAVQRLLADALPAPARAFETQGELVAYLVAGENIGSAAQAHQACMTSLRQRPRRTAIAPARYVICAGAPADPGALGSWRRLPVLSQGTGRPA